LLPSFVSSPLRNAGIATINKNKPKTASQKFACEYCSMRQLCVPGGLSKNELEQLDTLVSRRRTVRRGQSLFSEQDEFLCLFAIRSGFFKTSMSINKGFGEHVTGFQIPGEVLGLDGISTGEHSVQAVALDDSEVCVLMYSELERLARHSQPLQRQLHRVMSREIVREQGVMMLLGSMRAEQRVAAFLLNLAERYKNLGYSEFDFNLRMNRGELGSFLGLQLETVSRAISLLQDEQLIHVKSKQIKIIDTARLRQRACV